MPLSVPESLRTQVQELEQSAVSARALAAVAEQNKNKATAAVQEHRKTMGFWDRNFWGLFGNKVKVTEHKKLKSLSAVFNEKAAVASAKPAAIEAAIDGEIESYLSNGDPVYKSLQGPYNASRIFRSSVNNFLGTIDRALEAVQKAKVSENSDMMTDNPYFSTASRYDNVTANEAIQRVRGAAAAFQGAAGMYNKEMKAAKDEAIHLPGVDDTFDYVIDISGIDGNFDLTSMFSMNALSHAATDLEALRRDVVRADNRASQCADKAKAAIQSYKKQVRAACK